MRPVACVQCGSSLPTEHDGRGGKQPSRRYCSVACKQEHRKYRKPVPIPCSRCGRIRYLKRPSLAATKCRQCAQEIATAAALSTNTSSTDEKFAKYVDKTTGCWLWIGYRYSNGYGAITHERKQILVHRWAYERFVGPVPDGLTIDHLCAVRHCVNPDHLEPVTGAENTRRGVARRMAND